MAPEEALETMERTRNEAGQMEPLVIVGSDNIKLTVSHVIKQDLLNHEIVVSNIFTLSGSKHHQCSLERLRRYDQNIFMPDIKVG